MKKTGILHRDLNELIGSAAHGDFIIVSDAGLAIPSNIWRIELALARDTPDIPTVLRMINAEMIIEKVVVTEERVEYNQPMYQSIRSIFQETKLEWGRITHQKFLAELLPKAKAVVRTGSFSPFGNTILYPGIDAPEWFKGDGLKVPEWYRERVASRADS